MQRSTPLLSLVSLLLSFSLFAQSGVWGERGISRSFVTQGNFLYAADGRGVSAYDVGSARSVSRIDVEHTEGESNDVALWGSTDLIVGTRFGVERYGIAANGTLTRLGTDDSISAVSAVAANARYAAAASGKIVTVFEREGSGLTVVRKITSSGRVTAIAFVGDYLYVAAEREPLRVYQPPSSSVVQTLSGINAEDFALANNVLWSASASDGLTGIDVSNPRAPKLVAEYGRGSVALRRVAAAGNRVVAVGRPNELHVFDASTPAEPRLVTTMNEWVNVVALSGSRIFLAGNVVEESGLAFDPGLIPRETGKPVRVFENTTLMAEFSDFAGPVSGVWTDGSVAYVVDPPYLRVLDVSKTAAPREVMSFAIENIQDRIRVKNGKAILYGRAYVNYLDVSTPLRPRFLSTWDAQGHPPSGAAILKERVIEANEHSGMHIVDFSDPSRGIQIGGRIWHYHDVAAGEDAAYALMEDLMLVVEVAGEQTVIDRGLVHIQYEQVDTVPPNSLAPHALLVRGSEGLRHYSIAGEQRFAPQELSFLPVSGLGVFATGDRHAYVEKDGRLHFIDLTAPLALQATELRVTAAMQMSVAGEKIVVADRYAVRVYGPDTAPPPAPPAKRRAVRH